MNIYQLHLMKALTATVWSLILSHLLARNIQKIAQLMLRGRVAITLGFTKVQTSCTGTKLKQSIRWIPLRLKGKIS